MAFNPWAAPIVLGVALLLAEPRDVSAGSIEAWRGGPPPPLVLRNLKGEAVSLAALRGRTVIVNFWATWCAPCVHELPSLQFLYESLADKGLEVIAVNYQENATRIVPFLNQFGISMPVVRDHDGSVRAAWGVDVFPSTFVIGPDQKVAFVVIGEANWSAPQFESRVQALLPR